MSPDKWLEEQIGFETPRPGLERMKKAIGLFDLNLKNKKIITIAGTNGKGQTSRELFGILSKKFTVSLWTSPHLYSVTERFESNDGFVASSDLMPLFEHAKVTLDKADLVLSYFEFLFLNFLLFSKESEVLILEVGLGGRLDAVNAVDADISVITSISRDHSEYLGNRYDLILKEKIAVSRPNKILVSALELEYLRSLAKTYCQQNAIDGYELFELGVISGRDNFSIRNHKLAHFIGEKFFGIQATELNEESVNPIVEFDFEGARCHGLSSHNPDGVRKGVQFLNDAKYTNSYNLVLLSFSKREINDALTMIKTLKSWNASAGHTKLAITAFEHPKAMSKDEAKKLALSEQVEFFNDAKEAFIQSNMSGKQALVLGSNYFLASMGAKRSSSKR